MLRSLVVLVVFLIQFQLGACDLLYYWVDKSCDGRIPYVVGDTLRMAASAVFRLHDPQDWNQQQLFRRLFKTGPDDRGAVSEVIRVMGSIASSQPTNNHPLSDVRIYCDDDRRWSPVPDIPGDKNPNSRRRDGYDKEYEDVANGLRRHAMDIGCLLHGRGAETYTRARPRANAAGNHKPDRSAITLCDTLIDQGKKNNNHLGGGLSIPETFFGINPREDFTRTYYNDIRLWQTLISRALLHEFTHTGRLNKQDIELPPLQGGRQRPAYGYDEVTKGIQHRNDAMMNADTYAMFGLSARLADFRGRLRSEPSLAEQGYLVYDASLLPPNPSLAMLPDSPIDS